MLLRSLIARPELEPLAQLIANRRHRQVARSVAGSWLVWLCRRESRGDPDSYLDRSFATLCRHQTPRRELVGASSLPLTSRGPCPSRDAWGPRPVAGIGERISGYGLPAPLNRERRRRSRGTARDSTPPRVTGVPVALRSGAPTRVYFTPTTNGLGLGFRHAAANPRNRRLGDRHHSAPGHPADIGQQGARTLGFGLSRAQPFGSHAGLLLLVGRSEVRDRRRKDPIPGPTAGPRSSA
jgi:hypothetical protein